MKSHFNPVTILFILHLCFKTFFMNAQTDSLPGKAEKDSVKLLHMDEIVITVSQYGQNTFFTPRAMTVATRKEITEKNTFSVLDALDDKMGVWIEKRTTSTSDPVIRGLSGANVLALVNGQSLSTFWGEGGFAGDDLYGKIDGESIDRIEIIRGPASLMYGSNALGGVINFITKKSPLDFSSGEMKTGVRIRGASGSASEYLMQRAETWGADSNFRFFIGGTAHQSGNMRTGGNTGYISPSGGRDYSFDLNTEARLNSRNFISFGGQYMNRPEIYRSYRPNQSNSNERLGVNLGYKNASSTLLSDVIELKLYMQDKRDKRFFYKDKDLSSLDTLKEEGYAWWKTYIADLHALKNLGRESQFRLLYGFNYHVDYAESPDDEQFTIKTLSGDQPASPGTKWQNAGLYVQGEWAAFSWVTLSAGMRGDYFNFIADDELFYTKPGDPDPMKNQAITDPGSYQKNAITGSAAAVFHLGSHLNIASTWAHGFRMFPPSFGFRQTGQGVLIPNGLLDPVSADMFEMSFRTRSHFFEMNLTGYYTLFTNFQSAIFGKYEGSTHIDFNSNGTFEPDERVYVNTANGEAFVYGAEAEMKISIGELYGKLNGLYLLGGAMYNYGRFQYPGYEELPFRHTHPMKIVAKIRYEDPSPENKFWIELASEFVGKYNQVDPDRLKSDVGYLKNPQDPKSGLYAPYGLPSYEVYDIRGGIHFLKNTYVTLGVENILDSAYRSAHSRMDATGRNIQIGIEIEW